MSENSVGRPKEENPRNVQLKIKVTESHVLLEIGTSSF